MVVFVIPRLFTTSFIRPKNGGCLRLISMRMQLPPFNDSIGLVFKALECKHWHTEIGWFWTLGYFFVHKIHDHTQGSKVNNFIWNDLKKPNGSIGSYQSVPGPSKKKEEISPRFLGEYRRSQGQGRPWSPMILRVYVGMLPGSPRMQSWNVKVQNFIKIPWVDSKADEKDVINYPGGDCCQ